MVNTETDIFRQRERQREGDIGRGRKKRDDKEIIGNKRLRYTERYTAKQIQRVIEIHDVYLQGKDTNKDRGRGKKEIEKEESERRRQKETIDQSYSLKERLIARDIERQRKIYINK